MSDNFRQPSRSYVEYLMSNTNDRKRLEIQHQILKPIVTNIFNKVLDEYGLAERLAQATEKKLPILDAGCGEGLFLYDFADLLIARDLLEKADLRGADVDSIAINTAIEFCKVSNPSRPYLTFRVFDLNQNLERTPQPRYAFIYAILVLEHLPKAQKQLEYLYGSLLPGGVIYLRDFILTDSEDDTKDGWIAPHPAMIGNYRKLFAMSRSKNPGIEIAKTSAKWLTEMGAEKVWSNIDHIEAVGTSESGRTMLNNWLDGYYNGGVSLASRGLVTQKELDANKQTIISELTENSRGRSCFSNTLAQKPL